MTIVDYKMNKIQKAIDVLRTIKNYPIWFLDYFQYINNLNLTKKDFIIYNLKNGLKYKTRAGTIDCAIINEVCVRKIYLQEFGIDENDIVVDIGAHIGIFSVFASELAKKGKVYSFEPVPENFKILKENIELNKKKNIIPINKAVSSKIGKKEFFISKTNTGGGSLYLNNKEKKHEIKINVSTSSLKDIMRINKIKKIDFLKMDCEGEEYEILFNCPDKILKSVKKISMEYHNIDDKYNFSSLKVFLEKKGFRVKLGKQTKSGIGILYALNQKFN